MKNLIKKKNLIETEREPIGTSQRAELLSETHAGSRVRTRDYLTSRTEKKQGGLTISTEVIYQDDLLDQRGRAPQQDTGRERETERERERRQH